MTFEAGRCSFYFLVEEVVPTVSLGAYTELVTQKYTYAEVDGSPISPITVDGKDYSV